MRLGKVVQFSGRDAFAEVVEQVRAVFPREDVDAFLFVLGEEVDKVASFVECADDFYILHCDCPFVVGLSRCPAVVLTV